MPRYERIVSLAPSNTEILYALGVEDRIVATTDICDYPAEAEEKPGIGGWTNPDIEKVQAYDPDLVLASDKLQDTAVKQCENAGLTVKQVTPTKLHDVFNTIKAIGEFVEREEMAQNLVDELNEELQEIAVPPTAAKKRVYCEEWHEPPMISGNWVPRIVRMVGGEYLIAEGERSQKIETKNVQKFDPEHIFLHICGFGDAAEPEYITEREGWEDITAVKEGNVHVVDDSLLNRPGPRLIEGMEEMKQIVWSE